ncbi:hypothetical protein EDB85DRAFT_1896334 [Lactarius pseudohatsudake]|nr:hypothetical protein EDB85DRAFT_1896334 [Lactarius pseudohatsudake]
MVNHAKLNALKSQIARKQKDNLMAQAVALYQAEKAKSTGGARKPALLCAVCQIISDDYYLRTQIWIHLDHNTLARLSNGGTRGRSLTEANGEKSWLTSKEQDIIVQLVIESAR